MKHTIASNPSTTVLRDPFPLGFRRWVQKLHVSQRQLLFLSQPVPFVLIILTAIRNKPCKSKLLFLPESEYLLKIYPDGNFPETNIKHTNSVAGQQLLNRFIQTEVSISTLLSHRSWLWGKTHASHRNLFQPGICFDFQLKCKCCCEFYDISKYFIIWTHVIFKQKHLCPKPWYYSMDGKVGIFSYGLRWKKQVLFKTTHSQILQTFRLCCPEQGENQMRPPASPVRWTRLASPGHMPFPSLSSECCHSSVIAIILETGQRMVLAGAVPEMWHFRDGRWRGFWSCQCSGEVCTVPGVPGTLLPVNREREAAKDRCAGQGTRDRCDRFLHFCFGLPPPPTHNTENHT